MTTDRLLHSLGTPISATLRWLDTLLLLMVETFGDRYRRTKLAAFVAIGEPLGVIAVFALTHSLISSTPPFGTSNMLFFSTGILSFYLFFHISWRLRSWDWLRRLPRTTEFDLLLVNVFDELITKIVIIVICAVGLWLWGVSEAIPNDPLLCLLALGIIAMMGIAVGLINAVISAFFFAWLYIYAIVIRGWLAFSGVLFVVDWMPPQLREVAWYNPLAHAITLYRVGYYRGYPHASLDMQYLVVSTACMLVVALTALTVTKQWRTR
jgi:ABC-type polysaccharide/polyol phosphate export permease